MFLPWLYLVVTILGATNIPYLMLMPSVQAFTPPMQARLVTQTYIRHRAATSEKESVDNPEEDKDLDMSTFQARKKQQEEAKQKEEADSEEFDGYALRDVIYEKWGKCYDVDFNRVDSFGFRSLYLNVLPFHLGGRKFRHETEMDYLCHLQAVVEILEKYDQIGYVLAQIDETTKKPRAGTSPLVAVPLRLDLTREQVAEIIGY